MAAGFLLIIFGLFIHFQKAEAAVPKYLNFQTKLTKNSDGTNVADGNYSMQFKIYDALTSGNLLWTETWDGTAGTAQVQVANGVASVKLGTYTNLSTVDFTGGALYLTLNFNPGAGYDGEMLPRKQLLSAAFAFNANNLVGDGRIAIIATSTTQSAMQITYNPDSSTSTPAAIITASSNVTGPALKVIQNGSGAAALFSGGNIGIGSTTPTALLTVQGTSGSTTDLFNVASSTNSSLFKVASNGSTTIISLTAGVVQSTSNGNLYISPVALGTQISGVLAVNNGGTGTSTLPTVTGQLLMADGTGAKYQAGNLVAGANITITTTTPGSITIAATGGSANPVGSNTQLQYNNGGAFGGANLFYINGYEFGINSSTPTANLVVQGSSTNPTLPVFIVASSSNASFLTVAANGSTTISSLNSAGTVQTTASGALYVTGNTGSGLNVMQTSPTLITPILGIASGTSLSISGILWGNGQTNLTTASATALSVSGLSFFASSSVSGTFSATGSTTLSSLTSAGPVYTTSGGALYVGANVGGGTPCTTTGYSIQYNNNGAFGCVSRLITDGSLIGYNATSSTDSFNIQGTAGSVNDIFNVASSTGTSIFNVTANQRVGIGSSTPNATLAVQGTSTSPMLDILQVASSSNAILFNVTAAGNVGIGISAPAATLHVFGTGIVQSSTNTTTAFQVQNASGAAILLVDTTPTSGTTTVNIITNPGFEVNINGWGASTSATTIARAAAHKYLGISSLQVNTPAAVGSGATTSSFSVAIVTNTAYTLSFYARVDTASSSNLTFLQAGWATSTVNTLCNLNSATVSNNGWTRYFCTFTTSAVSVANFKIYIGQSDAVSRTFYLDAVQLQQSSSLTPYQIGNIQLRGVITSPVVLSSLSNSVTAFQIQDSAGTSNLFIANTLNGRIGIGTSTSATRLGIVGLAGPNDIFDIASSSSASFFRVTANGRVGINTTSPIATLAIQTQAGINAFTVASSTGATTTYFTITSIGRVGIGTSSPAARFSVAANCFKFASTTPANSTGLCNDYAEIYPASEPVETAEIVSSGKAEASLNSEGIIKKSAKPYDSGIIGVVSTNPAVVVNGNSVELMNGADYHHNPLSPAIALAGRVPVKIKADQVINIGDFITSSDVPGVGMKAERSGEVIGQALENFDPAAGAFGQPTVLVFIHPGYQVIGQVLELSELILSQGLDFSSPRMTSQEILQKLTSVSYTASSSLSFITTDRLVAGLDIITPQLTAKSLNVGDIQPSLDNSGITIGGEVYFIGRPYFTSDTAGFAVVNSGDSAVDVTFDKPYLEQPIVNASISANATSTAGALDQFALSIFSNNVNFIITNKSEQGFTILLNKPAPTDIQFSWMALAVRDAKTFSSKVSANDVAVSGPSGTAVSVPTPVVATTTASSSPVIIPADPRVLGASTTPLSETGAVPADAVADPLAQATPTTTSITALSGDPQPLPLPAVDTNLSLPAAVSPVQDKPTAPETP